MITPTAVKFLLRDLDDILEDSSFTSDMKDQCFQLIQELKYLKIYIWCLDKWNRSPFGKDKNFGFVEESHIESAFEEAGRKYGMSKYGFKGFDVVDSELLEKIQQCKPKIAEDCLNFLHCPFECEFSIDEFEEFMSSISASLHNLIDLKVDMMLDVKVQIESLEDKLDFFKEVFVFAAKRFSSLNFFKFHIQAWSCCAACLLLLYWVLDVKKEIMTPKMDAILSDLQKKISPTLVDFVLEGLDDLLADTSFTSDMKNHYFQLIHELKYLKIYNLCLGKWNRSAFGKDKNFGFVEESHIESAIEEAARKYRMSKSGFKAFDVADSELLQKIQQCKSKIAEDCLNFLHSPFECEFSIDELVEFMAYISASLHNLLGLKVDMMFDVKVQIESLEYNLDFFKEVFVFTAKRFSSLIDFKIHTQAWPCCAACLSLLYWVLDVKKEIMAPKMDVILSDLRKKISPTLVDFILKGLDNLLEDSTFPSHMKDRYFQLIHELKYLKFYMLCLAKWNDSSFGKDRNFGFVEESDIDSALQEAARKYRMSKYEFKGIDVVDSELLEKIQQCKPKIAEDCLNFLGCSFECEFSIDELPEFLSFISAFLHNLVNLKVDMMLDVKVQIETLADNLDFFKEVFEFSANRCSSHEDLKDFKIHIQAWSCKAACLSLLYWTVDIKKENMTPKMDVILSDLKKKIGPSTPNVTRMYLAVLKASKPSTKDSLTVGKLVWEFVVFLKNNLQVDPEKDGIQMLFIELIFLTTFLMDHPEAEKLTVGKLIATQADAVVDEVASLISSLSSGEMKKGIARERNFLLHTFLQKTNAIKAEVRKLYVHLFPDPSSFNFPRINVLGFIDSLLENFKEFCFHFPNHQIVMLQEELLSLKESNLKDFSIINLQNRHKAIKDLWTRIVNVAYNIERAVSTFICTKESLWHNILVLSDVIEEVKLIKVEVKRIQDQHMYDIDALNSETSLNPVLHLRANIQVMDKFVVGFKDEVEGVRDRLISGSKELQFISIVGMPGLGKTTLAKKLYSDALVRYHFNKCAWCTVSQTFNSKRMLLDVLSDVANFDVDLSDKKEEDLAERVYRSLKGQRYLIVMDDIWNVNAWDALKKSFPEDNKGSRIMFTSRIHNVILEPKSRCTTFPLHPLSERESWELLRKKLFAQDNCPSDFLEIGKQIATNCKGLPLSIILTAGLLKEKIESLDWWKQVAESLDSLITKEGCGDVVELSYKHLPEFLKPCFLYFGLFQEAQEIRVKKLTLLWISEGFIQKHDQTKSSEVVAEEYLMDLVARSLVIVTKRSSKGGIKACVVHDLLHDFCIAKGEEENFCKVIRGNEVSNMASTYAHYRVSIQTDCWRSFLEHAPPASSVHSLLYSHPPFFERIWSFAFSYFKFIRVLDIALSVLEFPEELVLLRYLAIYYYYSSTPPWTSSTVSYNYPSIPSSMKRLKNLEVLCLYGLKRMPYELPLTLWEMQKLRHVSGHVLIPTDFYDYDIAPLENVQTFSLPLLGYEQAEMFLRTIPKVRELKCEFHLSGDHKNCHSIVKLDFLTHLESLSLSHSTFDFPLRSSTFYLPSTLKKLSLTNFQLPWSQISPIAKLPNLEVLKLYYGSFRGKTWNVRDDELLKLKCLVLEWLDIRQLNASDDSFACLEHLVVYSCHYLEEIPSIFGSIATLKVIQVKNCTSTLNSSVRQIQEDQVELGNEHLEVNIWRN